MVSMYRSGVTNISNNKDNEWAKFEGLIADVMAISRD